MSAAGPDAGEPNGHPVAAAGGGAADDQTVVDAHSAPSTASTTTMRPIPAHESRSFFIF